ncbi:hypothetical protein [Salinithrix halophila]|uniref:DUF308 domain-containing protein n=1 Tax=Salinithrix halophila TaxID=1485204 RepID=A0ABV8J9B3_9BACL
MEEKPNSRAVYYMYFVSSFFGLLAILTPEPSRPWITCWLAIIIVGGIWTLIGFIQKLDQNRHWRGIYGLIQSNLFSVFGFVFFYRGTGEKLWIGILSILVFVTIAGWAFKNRRLVLSEILSPKRKISLILRLVAMGGGGGVLAGLVLGKAFPSLAPVMIGLVSAILLLVWNSLWVKTEDPDWEPEVE